MSGTPTPLSPGFTTPSDGSEWVSAWLDAPLGGDVERLLCFGYDTPEYPWALTGGSYQTPGSGSATSGAVSRSRLTPFDIWIEAETTASTPVIASIGDSLTSGTGASLPVHDSWLSQYTRRTGGLPLHVSHHGDSMTGFLNVNPGKVTRWEHLARADATVWSLGSNDISAGRSLKQMKADFHRLRTRVETSIGPVTHVSTVPPRASWPVELETQRIAWNSWLTAQPFAHGVLDFAAVVSDGGASLDPRFDSGDGTHLNTAGYAAQALSVVAPLAELYR